DRGVAVQADQRLESLPRRRREAGAQRADLGRVLCRQRGVDRVEAGRVDRHAGENGTNDARVGEIDDDVLDRGDVQALEHQVEDLDVGGETVVTIDLGTELQGLARRAGAGRARMQHRAAVAEANDTGSV